MGNSSFTKTAKRIIEVVRDNVSDSDERAMVYKNIIDVFEDFDFDNIDELTGIDSEFDKIAEANEAFEDDSHGIDMDDDDLLDDEEDEDFESDDFPYCDDDAFYES